ncbi:MAG: 2-oxoacid:acceptor oxidoreductase family protein [Candidatus Rokubacteria bacterium]|nr:2-oxoacid:acceptor oxidoreductase family protein [Candidatus Rokubacteria bacterium]
MTAPEQPSFLGDRPFPYCKGCGHGLVARGLGRALAGLGLDPSQIVLTTDIGCVGLVDPLFPAVHTVHTIHGRSTAVAAGAVLADALLGEGRMKNIVMIGDGGATIGLLHLTQAALMNVDLAVLLHNNMLYGMTGGQHSALTPEGFATSTTLQGNWVPALDMEQLLRGCQAGFFARQLATDAELATVIAEAIAFPGFALVEILELCTGFGVPLNHMDGKALRALAEADGRQLGRLIHRKDRRPYHKVYRAHFPAPSGPPGAVQPPEAPAPAFPHRLQRPVTLVIAGSAGERVQTAAATLCQAAVLSGLHCVQKNDYPVTVGSGFSLSEVKLSPEPILYTGTEAPDAVLITSADGLREIRGRGDLGRLAPGALVIADESLAADLPVRGALCLPLRRALSPAAAALGAVAVLNHRRGILAREALLAATAGLGGSAGGILERALDAALSLAPEAAARSVEEGRP